MQVKILNIAARPSPAVSTQRSTRGKTLKLGFTGRREDGIFSCFLPRCSFKNSWFCDMAHEEDIDELLCGLTDDDLQILSDEIDPENELLPVHERQGASNYTVDINTKIKDMEKLSIESIEGDNYLPLEGRNWKPPAVVDKKEQKKEDDLPEDWKEMLESANEKDLQELAEVLGVHSILTQEQSLSSEKEKLSDHLKALSTKPATSRYTPKRDIRDHYEELQQVDVTALFRRLKDFDKELTEVSLNNMKEIDDVLVAVADFLSKVDTVTKISVANSMMNNVIGMKFAEALKHNNSLVFLNMESNYLSGEVVAAILEALQDNTTLTELKLSNQSKTAGAHNEREIVNQLEKNHTLRKFGFAFYAPGIGEMASRFMLRNNDEARKKRLSATKK